MITDQEKVQLFGLLSKATGGGENFSFERMDVMVTIGKGMFWSKELDANAKHLAKIINEEFKRQGQD